MPHIFEKLKSGPSQVLSGQTLTQRIIIEHLKRPGRQNANGILITTFGNHVELLKDVSGLRRRKRPVLKPLSDIPKCYCITTIPIFLGQFVQERARN